MAVTTEQPENTSTGRKRRGRRWGRFMAALLALLIVLGGGYEAINEALDIRRYPPPGDMVDLGGYSLHLHCTGEGSPTVILEGGLGGGVVTWPFVQPTVAMSTRVCSYDRSGWAWSGGSTPGSGHDSMARLHSLLERAGEKAPYILVGHSLGGLYNQLYAAAYPDEVAGMVLVEARHQDFAQRMSAAGQGSDSGGSLLNRLVVPLLTRLGLVRVLGHLGALPGVSRELPPGMMEMAIRPSSQESASSEQRLIPSVEAEVRSASIALGSKPVVVVMRDRALSASSDSGIWLETQRLYLTLSTSSRLVEAKGSGHMVPYDNPAAVTAAITEVLKATR